MHWGYVLVSALALGQVPCNISVVVLAVLTRQLVARTYLPSVAVLSNR